MNSRRLICTLSLLLGLVACSHLPRATTIIVTGLVFHNTTATPIHNAKLSVSQTHEMVACGIILPGKECSTTFPQREYQGNPVMVSWEQAGRRWSVKALEVKLPADGVAKRPTIALITLAEHGAISARLVPQPSAGPTPTEIQLQLR